MREWSNSPTRGKTDPLTFVTLQNEGVFIAKNMSVACVLKAKMIYSCFMFTVQKLMRNNVQ